jgi:UPF0755 protein
VLRRLIILAAGLALIAGAATYWFLWAAAGPKAGPHTVVVEEGSSLARVAAQLEKAGAIPGSARTYRVMARIFGSSDPVQAGEFEIPSGMAGSAILDLLQHGQPVQRLVTIPEGTPSIIVQEKVAALKHLSGDAPLPEEGSVLPDSYGYKRGESRAALIGRMQAAMAKTLDRLWAQRKPARSIRSRRR